MPGQRESEDVRRGQIIRAAYQLAERRGLDAVTVRDVAARAGVSHGLVLFHYKTKGQLVLALLDWLLETTAVLHVTEDLAAIVPALDRFLALLGKEMNRLSSEPCRIRLFFEFWAKGIRNADIRARMRRELDRYREAFRPIAEEVLRAEPERFAHVTASGLAAVAVSFIKGCAVQSVVDPDHFDIDEFLAAANALLGRLASASPATPLRRGVRSASAELVPLP
jgi:AcrR family transcriptional regulator